MHIFVVPYKIIQGVSWRYHVRLLTNFFTSSSRIGNLGVSILAGDCDSKSHSSMEMIRHSLTHSKSFGVDLFHHRVVDERMAQIGVRKLFKLFGGSGTEKCSEIARSYKGERPDAPTISEFIEPSIPCDVTAPTLAQDDRVFIVHNGRHKTAAESAETGYQNCHQVQHNS